MKTRSFYINLIIEAVESVRELDDVSIHKDSVHITLDGYEESAKIKFKLGNASTRNKVGVHRYVEELEELEYDMNQAIELCEKDMFDAVYVYFPNYVEPNNVLPFRKGG